LALPELIDTALVSALAAPLRVQNPLLFDLLLTLLVNAALISIAPLLGPDPLLLLLLLDPLLLLKLALTLLIDSALIVVALLLGPDPLLRLTLLDLLLPFLLLLLLLNLTRLRRLLGLNRPVVALLTIVLLDLLLLLLRLALITPVLITAAPLRICLGTESK